jgi:hypothetical protein
MEYRLLRTIAGKGTAPGQFTTMLRGVCVDSAGLVYAVGDRAVKVFDSAGKRVREWSIQRPAYCVAVQASKGGNVIWVGESGQVERFETSGKGHEPFTDGARLGTVTAVGFSGEHVLVGDASARCIRHYDCQGKWIQDIGKDNNTQGFLIPNGVLDFRVDAAGVIHAANPAKHRVERYDLDGKLLGHFGKFGMQRPEDFGGCCNPTNIALLPDGMVVSEKAPPRVKIFDRAGTVTVTIGPEAFDKLCKNMSLTVDPKGHIYVADTERLSILVFAPASDTVASRAAGGGR